MYSTYRLKANELNNEFLESLKLMFHDREIEIIVRDVEDETEYILKSEGNKKRLLKAIKNVENNSNLLDVNLDDLK